MIEKVRAGIEELKAQRAKALEKIEESISAKDEAAAVTSALQALELLEVCSDD